MVETLIAVGVFSLLSPNVIPADTRDVNKSYMAGYAYRLDWKQLEPTNGGYNWTLIDQAVAQTKTLGKKCRIHLTAGYKSPDWIYSAGVPKAFVYVVNGVTINVPLITNDAYINLWKRFITAFANRHGRESCIAAVHISGCGLAGELTLRAEGTIPDPDWAGIGVTDADVVAAWKKVIPHYVSKLRYKALCTPGVTPWMTTQGDPTGAQIFGEWLLSTYGDRIGIYNHGLEEGGPPELIRDAIRTSSPLSGYQSTGGFLLGGWLYPESGDPSVAFQQAIDDGVTSVEIYRSDLLQNDPVFEGLVQDLAENLEYNFLSVMTPTIKWQRRDN